MLTATSRLSKAASVGANSVPFVRVLTSRPAACRAAWRRVRLLFTNTSFTVFPVGVAAAKGSAKRRVASARRQVAAVITANGRPVRSEEALLGRDQASRLSSGGREYKLY